MRHRRSLLALLALPLLPAEARGFRLAPADGETERLLADRNAACASGQRHEDLAAELAAALERARASGDPREAEQAVLAALGTCPFCGCGLAFAPLADGPAPF